MGKNTYKGNARLGLIIICIGFWLQGISGINASGLTYIPNEGQWHPEVAYRAQLTNGRFFLQKQGFTYTFLAAEQLKKMHNRKSLSGSIDAHAIKVQFKGAKPEPRLKGSNKTGTTYNYYLGSNPDRWQQGLPAFKDVKYQGLYEGINLDVTTSGSRIKYNFQVGVGEDPDQIQLAYKGADSLYIDGDGNLVIKTSVNKYREMAPKAYQVIDGDRRSVPCQYELEGNQLSFSFPQGYKDNYPLTIDPEVIFSTFSGSIADNFGYSATYDSQGHGYSAGTVFGSDFPDTSGPGGYQVKWGGGTNTTWGGGSRDIGILKYNDSGTALKYATFLGGSGNEDPHSMVVNSDQDLIVFGNTGSSNFPTTANAYDTTYNGNYDIYVSKLSEDGNTLKASTFVGGNDMDGLNGKQQVSFRPYEVFNTSNLGWNYGDMFRGEVIVDNKDRVLVSTTTKSGQSFPVTNGSFQTQYGGGDQDGCVLRLDDSLKRLEAASFIGGGLDDAMHSLTIAPDQSILVAGGTVSNQLKFPVNGYQNQNMGGEADAMVLRISRDFSTVKAASFLGTTDYDQAYFVQTTPSGKVYLTGQTTSNQFPTKNANYSVDSGKQFVTKLDKQLDNILLSATFGSGDRSSPDLSPSAFLVDTCGKIYFSGWGGGASDEINYDGGNTKGLPVTKGAFDTTTDGSDFYITVFAEDMEKLLYGTYYGGDKSSEHVDGGTSRFDESGIIYQSICAGCGGYSDLPTTKNAHSRVNRGTRPSGGQTGCNNALLKIDLNIQNLLADFEIPEATCIADSVTLNNKGRFADSFIWYLGNGDTVYQKSPTIKYNSVGTYTIRQVAINPFGCDDADTAEKQLTVYDQLDPAITIDTGECVNNRRFSYTGQRGDSFVWRFGDSSQKATDSVVNHTYKDTGTFTVSCVVDPGLACGDTVYKQVHIGESVKAKFDYSIDTCSGEVTFQNRSREASDFIWVFEGNQKKQTGIDSIKYQYGRSDTFHPTLIAGPDKKCADTTTETLRLNTVLSQFTYTIDEPCNFGVLLRNSADLSDSVVWQVSNTRLEAKDSLKTYFPGPGVYDVSMWIKGAPAFCQDTTVRTISLDTLPEIGFEAEHPTCEPFFQVVPDSGNADTIQWNLSDKSGQYDTTFKSLTSGNQLPIPASRSSYTIEAIGDPVAACPDTVEKQVEVDSLSKSEFRISLDTCEQKIVTKNLSPKAIQYRWAFGDQTESEDYEPTHRYDNTGTYPVTLFTEDGLCRDTSTNLVEILPIPAADFTIKRDTCSTRTSFTSGSNPDHPHFWNLGEGDTSTQINPDKVYNDTGRYKIKLVIGPEDRCADTSEKILRIPDFVRGNLSVYSDPCKPQLTLNADTSHADSFVWKGDIQPYLPKVNTDSLTINLPESGAYTVSLISFSDQCKDTARDTVLANPEVVSDFDFEQIPCQSKFRFYSQSKGANDYLWLWGDGKKSRGDSSLTHTYENSGVYPLRHITNPGRVCADTAKTSLKVDQEVVKPIDVPNVFTPNGDGVNDQFRIQGLGDCKKYEIYIYNRWGQLVHHKDGKDLSWDGSGQRNAKQLSSGTYFYKLKGPAFQQEGTITLIGND